MRKYYLFSLGCKVNSYENNAVGTLLDGHGYQRVFSPEEADAIILNTCSVTSRADQKSRQHIAKMRKANPNAALLVMGCYSQLHSEKTEELGADIILGGANRAKAWEYLEAFFKEKETIIDIKKTLRHEAYEEFGVASYSEMSRAYLKIQDGCSNFCAYCLIPTTRGNSRSRRPGEVIREARKLVDDGFKEIIITGIHIGGYGQDLGDGSYRLADLLEDLMKACPDLYRLRISSIEESEIDDRFLSLLEEYPAIARHLHIPLQSGSSTVLKRMKRKYDTEAFLAKLAKIREILPDVAITTDVIAGFPEESQQEWEETVRFAQRAQFAEIHVFPFSSRPGTFAATRPDTDPKVKKERVHELLQVSKKMRSEYEAKFYGQEMEVLFEDFDPEKKLVYGHTSNYLLVSMPSEVSLHGQIRKIIYSSQSASD